MLFATDARESILEEPRNAISKALGISVNKCKLMRTMIPSKEPQAWSTHRSIFPLYHLHSDATVLTRQRDKIQGCVSLLSLMGLSGVDHPSIFYPELTTA